MNMPFARLFTNIAVAAALAATVAAPAAAQDYPSKRLTIVVANPAGGSSDVLARLLAERLSQKERLGQPVIVENKAGAFGYIGHDFVAKAPADGYTLLLAQQILSAPKQMRAMENFDPSRLTPVGRVAGSPWLVLVPSELPHKSLPDLIQHAKANPDTLNYGLVPGSVTELDMMNFGTVTGAKMTPVPFNGGAPMVTALLGNHVQMGWLSVTGIPHVQSGKLRALAVTARNRWPRMPDVPTMQELGFPFEASFWFGLAVPAGTPAPVIARLSKELTQMLAQPDVQEAIGKLGMDPIESSAEEMARQIERERKVYEEVASRIKPAPSR